MAVTLTLFFLATFGIVAAGVIGYGFFLERRTLLHRAPDSGDVEVGWIEPSELLKTDSLSTISFWRRLLERFDYVDVMRVRLAESGLKWSVGRLTAMMLLAGAIGFALAGSGRWLPGWVSLAFTLGAVLLPYGYVLRVRRKRLEKFESQFADALDSLARALRAGHPLAAGFQMLAYEAPEPLALEMRITADERRLGHSWDDALDNLATRVPLVEMSVFVAAVKLQSRTGGKLSEVLGRLSESMRSTHALKSEVRSIAAHGKMTGNLLSVLPVVIAALMFAFNPRHMEVLWAHPSGKDLIAAALIALVAAHFLIRKMVDIRI